VAEPAQVIIAEIGLDMGRFPTPAHLALLGPVRPWRHGVGRQDQGQEFHRARQPLPGSGARRGRRGRRTNTFLGERYRRIARRRGAKGHRGGRPLNPGHRLAPAVGPRRPLPRSGSGFYDGRVNAERARRNHVRQLEALGYKVTLHPAA
jgi:transposase